MNSPLQNFAWRHRRGCSPALSSTSGAERVSYETESGENILIKLQNWLMKLGLHSKIWCINDCDDLWADLKGKTKCVQAAYQNFKQSKYRASRVSRSWKNAGIGLCSHITLPPPSPDFLESCATYIAIPTFSSSQVCTSLGVQNGTWHLTFSEVARVAKGLSRGLKLLGKGAWEADFLLHNLSPVPHVIGSDA